MKSTIKAHQQKLSLGISWSPICSRELQFGAATKTEVHLVFCISHVSVFQVWENIDKSQYRSLKVE